MQAEERVDTTVHHHDSIYQGVLVKVDLMTPAIEAGRSKGEWQDYEMAVSVRLKDRYYPTLEGGYAFGRKGGEDNDTRFRGVFMRVGMDFNGLRKNIHSPHALLIGLRLGTACHQYDYTDTGETALQPPIVQETGLQSTCNRYKRWDVWGELVGGCNVQIASGFYMGWHLRLKVLMTRKKNGNDPRSNYIPGFGTRSEIGWGVSYYIGWRF